MTYIRLDLLDLALPALLLVLNGALSVALNLGLERQLAAAALRMVVQLLLIGYVLAALFALALALRVVGSVPVITSDEGYWMQRTLRFGAALAAGDWVSTYCRGHPGVTVMWLVTMCPKPARRRGMMIPACRGSEPVRPTESPHRHGT